VNYTVIGTYPTSLDKDQLKSYVSILLNIAAIDEVSQNEMALIKQLAKDANVEAELLEECIESYRSFDVTKLPDYSKQWAYCILRDAVLIADCDDGISEDEIMYLNKIANFAGIDLDFEKVLNITLAQKQTAEQWEALLCGE
jgi:tellurite resistance protein